MRLVIHEAKKRPARLVLPEGEDDRILRAGAIIVGDGIAKPTLLGRPAVIGERIRELGLDLKGVEIINPPDSPRLEKYAEEYFGLGQRKGKTLAHCRELMRLGREYGPMMVRVGDADSVLTGITTCHTEALRSAVQVIGTDDAFGIVAGMFMLIFKERVYFFADTTVNVDPSDQELAGIAQLTARYVKKLGYEPRIAMLSFSNFGSVCHEKARKVKSAVAIVKQAVPNLMIDGEMQADTAVVPELIESTYPFAKLRGGANVLVFPDLQSADIACKLCSKLGGAEAVGPIMMGLKKSAHILPHGCEVDDVVNMAAIAVTGI
jgi:malate dehydrogenase (oxaloacetate-decarboxylating)(NADP+)